MHSSGDAQWPVLFQFVSWPEFLSCFLEVTYILVHLFLGSELHCLWLKITLVPHHFSLLFLACQLLLFCCIFF